MDPPSKRSCHRFPCPYTDCEATFARKDGVKTHERLVHLKERDFACQEAGCSATFGTRAKLEQHVKSVHLKIRDFECSVCGRAFSKKGDLNTHVRCVHEKHKPYTCAGCSAVFSKKWDLDKHVEGVHLRAAAFQCSYPGCKAAFGQEANLQVHIDTVHRQQRHFTCGHPGCSAAFGQKSNLTTHVNVVHLGQKHHVCEYEGCTAKFGRKPDLVNHIKLVHLEEKKHICDFPMCDYRAGIKANLIKHTKAIHSEEGQQRQKRQEAKVKKALDEAGIDWKPEHHVSFACWDDTFARCDLLVLEKGCVLFGEVDEDQHEHYGVLCEVARMTKMHTAAAIEGNTLPIVFIRYNPNVFKVDGELKRVRSKDRLARLVEVIQNWQAGPEGSLQIQYMYYDCHTINDQLRLDIWDDSNYSQDVMACCKQPIV